MKSINPLNYFRLLMWSMRKLLLPIKRNDLILEVGSGGNPHPYSSILVERYLSNKHRLKEIEIDKRLVLADACKLPFKDLTFDYSLSFHVLEHVDNPAGFLNETQRTSRAGYIETPNFLYERLKPFDVHLLEVAKVKDVLHINKKNKAIPDEFISGLNIIETNSHWNNLFSYNPKLFHVQLYWKDKIKYLIRNNDVSTDWFIEPNSNESLQYIDPIKKNQSINLRKLIISFLKKSRKNHIIDHSIFVCPECKGHLNKTQSHFFCKSCSLKFKRIPIPDFTNAEEYCEH